METSATSTENALFRAMGNERGLAPRVTFAETGGDASVIAAPSTVDATFGAAGAGGGLTAPWFGGARFEIELVTPERT